MVLTLKRWKSRSSPGIAAGGCCGEPIHSFKRPLPVQTERRFFLSLALMAKISHQGVTLMTQRPEVRRTSQGRPAARSGQKAARKAKDADASAGA